MFCLTLSSFFDDLYNVFFLQTLSVTHGFPSVSARRLYYIIFTGPMILLDITLSSANNLFQSVLPSGQVLDPYNIIDRFKVGT